MQKKEGMKRVKKKNITIKRKKIKRENGNGNGKRLDSAGY